MSLQTNFQKYIVVSSPTPLLIKKSNVLHAGPAIFAYDWEQGCHGEGVFWNRFGCALWLHLPLSLDIVVLYTSSYPWVTLLAPLGFLSWGIRVIKNKENAHLWWSMTMILCPGIWIPLVIHLLMEKEEAGHIPLKAPLMQRWVKVTRIWTAHGRLIH